jgi:hypothetical protein
MEEQIRTAETPRQNLATRRAHQAAALVFLAIGAYVTVTAPGLVLYDDRGPGPGLFPFCVGLLMIPLALVWLFRLTARGLDEEENAPFFEGSDGFRRVALLALGTVLLGALVPVLGFQVTVLVMVVGFLLMQWPGHIIWTIVLGCAASFGLYYVFTALFGAMLPISSLPFLSVIGL